MHSNELTDDEVGDTAVNGDEFALGVVAMDVDVPMSTCASAVGAIVSDDRYRWLD